MDKTASEAQKKKMTYRKFKRKAESVKGTESMTK